MSGSFFGIADYTSFVVAIIVFLLIPGPGNLALITSTSKGGIAGGLGATFGVIAGDQVLLWAAVAGVSAVMAAYQTAFHLVQWMGAVYRHLDVTRASDWTAALDELIARWGRIDVLVNNAAIHRVATFAETCEFELLDAVPPTDEHSCALSWEMEESSFPPNQARWLELYKKHKAACDRLDHDQRSARKQD